MEEEMHSADEATKRASELPLEVQKMLYSPEMTTIIQKVGQKYQLHIDQIDLLNAETGQVMLGFTQSKDYPETLVESLKIDQTKADAIAQDINDLLFIKIRESMKQASGVVPSQEPQTPSLLRPQTLVTQPTTPTVQFPNADIQLTQKTVTTPIPSALISVPSTTIPATTTPPTPVSIPNSDVAPTSPTIASETPVPPITPPRPYNKDPYHEPIE